jgi:hypothetical protein
VSDATWCVAGIGVWFAGIAFLFGLVNGDLTEPDTCFSVVLWPLVPLFVLLMLPFLGLAFLGERIRAAFDGRNLPRAEVRK